MEDAMWKPYGCDGLMVFAVNAKEIDPFGALLPEVAQLTFPLLNDVSSTSSLFLDQSNVSPFPLNVLVDWEGRVRFVSQAHSIPVLADQVEALLDEMGVSPSGQCGVTP